MLSTILLGIPLALCWGAGASLLLLLMRGEPDRTVAADAAIGAGLPAGLLLLAFPGWLVSAALPAPMPLVLALGLAACAAAIAAAAVAPDARLPWRAARLAACVVAGLFLLFLFLRLGTPDVRQTEKPMDAAVLSALLATPALPLGDPWLAGARFPYYHFGTLLLALPARLARVPAEYAYNLVAALLPALAGGAALAAVRLRGGSRRLAAAAGLALPLAGTLDGARELLAGGGIDLWASSRRVEHAITEWPFFTFQLGDLHPHAFALVLLLVLAGLAGRIAGWRGALLEAAVVAALLSANPWDLPGALLLVALGAWMARPLREAAARALGVLAAAALLLVPFVLSPRPPLAGLRVVTQATTSAEAFLHLGAFVAIPALALGVGLPRWRRNADEALFAATLLPAAGIALSIVTLRPVLGLAAAACAAALVLAPRAEGALRAGLLLLVAACVLAAFPELFAVKDPYGEELQRMNTLFKCWSAAAPLFVLASALLGALALATRRARWVPRAVLVAVAAGAAVHPLSLLLPRLRHPGGTLDGLAWMSREAPGDRAAVNWLRAHADPRAVIAEAPGVSYDAHARVSAFSGRATLLGWSGHEGLWRGERGATEIAARQADLRTIYASREAARVRETLRRRHVRYVVLGGVERADFGPDAFPLRRLFPAVLDVDGTALYDTGGA